MKQTLHKLPLILVTAIVSSFLTYYYCIYRSQKAIIEAAIPRSVWNSLSSDDKN